jgi:hypothetical protein
MRSTIRTCDAAEAAGTACTRLWNLTSTVPKAGDELVEGNQDGGIGLRFSDASGHLGV